MPIEGVTLPDGAERGVIDDDTVYDLIRTRAETTPGLPMAFDEHRRRITFGEYHDRVLKMARGLLDAGLTPKRRVAWQLNTSIEALILAGALSRLGMVQVLLLPAYRMHELTHIVGEAEPEALIVSTNAESFDFLSLATDVQREFPWLRVLTVDEINFESDTQLPEYLPPTAGDPRFLIYTSGTTGKPKGVQHSDQSAIAGSRAQYLALEIGPNDRQTLNFPFAHIGGIMNLVTMMATGASSVLVERFEPEKHVPLFRELHVTLPGTGPVFVRMYLDVQRRQPGQTILPDARGFPGGGAPKTPTMHADVKNEIGSIGLLTGYGMSECPLITTVHIDSPDEKKAMTDGLPAMGISIRLVDELGDEVPTGQDGEIRIKGRQVFLGYVDPELNQAAFDGQGYFRTGDLGRFDEDGYMRLTGRLKELIIRKGENISPREIEDLLHSHQKVSQVVVVGVPDQERGEMVCAVVVPADPRDPIGFEEMSAYLSDEGLARHKFPERLEIWGELPKNAMGKVLKQELRALLSRGEYEKG